MPDIPRWPAPARLDDVQAGLLAAIEAIAPRGVTVAGGPIGAAGDPIFPEEFAVRGSAPKRRAEFHAGRAYARMALQKLGVEVAALPSRRDRSPDWPSAVVGSISHCDRLCAAATARRADFWAIGLDVEHDTALSPDVIRLVATPREVAERMAGGRLAPGEAAKQVFSIKEAIYKAYAPATGGFLDFLDVEISVDGARGAFQGRLVNPARPDFFGERTIEGEFGLFGGLIFALSSREASRGG